MVHADEARRAVLGGNAVGAVGQLAPGIVAVGNAAVAVRQAGALRHAVLGGVPGRVDVASVAVHRHRRAKVVAAGGGVVVKGLGNTANDQGAGRGVLDGNEHTPIPGIVAAGSGGANRGAGRQGAPEAGSISIVGALKRLRAKQSRDHLAADIAPTVKRKNVARAVAGEVVGVVVVVGEAADAELVTADPGPVVGNDRNCRAGGHLVALIDIRATNVVGHDDRREEDVVGVGVVLHPRAADVDLEHARLAVAHRVEGDRLADARGDVDFRQPQRSVGVGEVDVAIAAALKLGNYAGIDILSGGRIIPIEYL